MEQALWDRGREPEGGWDVEVVREGWEVLDWGQVVAVSAQTVVRRSPILKDPLAAR